MDDSIWFLLWVLLGIQLISSAYSLYRGWENRKRPMSYWKPIIAKKYGIDERDILFITVGLARPNEKYSPPAKIIFTKKELIFDMVQFPFYSEIIRIPLQKIRSIDYEKNAPIGDFLRIPRDVYTLSYTKESIQKKLKLYLGFAIGWRVTLDEIDAYREFFSKLMKK